MSSLSTFRAKKNCLLVFRNKKINVFDKANDLINSFSGFGYYFDKISYIAYDRAEEIVSALKDGRENYENVFIFCPYSMDSTLKSFINAMYSAQFSENGILEAVSDNVFILFSDTENTLKYDDIRAILDKKYGVRYEKAYIKAMGVPSSLLNSLIHQAKGICPEADFNISDEYGDCRIEIVYSSAVPKTVFDSMFKHIVSGLGDRLYAMEDVSLAERLFQLLKLRRMKISIAESFTGGGIGKKLVEIPGISEVYFEGLNTYANEAKTERLGVQEFTLDRYGAVSEQTASQMAEGLLSGGRCDICIATTGIAGPASDNTLKPVGLSYLAIGTRDNIAVYEYNLKGNREAITNTAINLALFLAFKTLK